MKTLIWPGAALLAATLLTADTVHATTILGPAITAETVGGVVEQFIKSDESLAAKPWTAEVFTEAHQCLRLAVLTQDTDLKMVVTAPNGQTYRNDDGGGQNRPLIKLNDPPVKGYYSVHISEYQGDPVNAVFTVRFQRLPKNSASCLPATVQLTCCVVPE